ncbi:carbonic anhydrase [Tistrella bauzanensis]|uniref:Carbonic anhydrase n=1 Tax=Tistrella bauzanensis TaxID=657419 RepID=A0ABQ1J7H5_9PROT|nr:carbonic anhydrase [Tistrella bauzanensis]GGB59881.1 carbonic anhydrase [Tistrella bauzanensis]
MDALNKVIEGFRRFRDDGMRNNPTLFASLAREQTPKVMMIACCDSRVDPALITSADPGDLFILRNVANLVPPFEPDGARHGTSAALEFAVNGLGVQHVVVLGHASCGGIRALVQRDPEQPNNDFIDVWMSQIADVRARILHDHADVDAHEHQHLCELESIKVSLANLATFPWIADRLTAGTIRLHGWYYDIANARILAYDREADAFLPL